MILLIRDNECFEPRVQNYIQYFSAHGIPFHVIAWNRNGTARPDPNITFFQRRAEYGKRIANIPNKVLWMLFVMQQVFRHRKDCTAIHACDIDAVLPALILGRPLGKKVIFDIFDWISSLTGKGIVYKLVEFLQNFCYRHSDAVILCEEARKAQAKAVNQNIFIVPNIPNGPTVFDPDTLSKTAGDLTAYRYVISYVGVFDRDRGLENLLKAVSEQPDIRLNIAGFGVLDAFVQDHADRYPNICYWGRVDYAVGQAIEKNSHLIAAMYHLTSPLHKYAAPNKYYESLLLGVPMITTENTLVAAKTVQYDTGFILDESVDSLRELFRRTTLMAEIEEKAQNCIHTWDAVYKTYYEDYMKDRYMRFVRQ